VASGPRKCDGEEEFADYHFNGDAFTSDCYTESLDCRSSINKLNKTLLQFNEIDPVKSCKAFCDTIEGCQNWTLTSTPLSANFLQCYALSSCYNSVVASGPRKCDGEEEFADYHFNGGDECCTLKEVGGIEYELVGKIGNPGDYECLNGCTYVVVGGNPNLKYCFKHGNLTVECESDKKAPCYEDNPERILPYAFIESDLMTIERCKEHCFVKNNYNFAGVQFYNQCFCGNDKPDESLIRDLEECNAPCAGNDQQICGGTWRMNIYQI